AYAPNDSKRFSQYLNGKCSLKCKGRLDYHNRYHRINEGRPCVVHSIPGVCFEGVCQSPEAALDICTKLHNIKLKEVNSNGTEFINQNCAVKCVMLGKTIGQHAIHEGERCPGDFNKVSAFS